MGAFDYQQQRRQAKAAREQVDASGDIIGLLGQLVWEQQQTNAMLDALVKHAYGIAMPATQ